MSTDTEPGDLEAPKIEFPCLYPIKIIGIATESFQQDVIAVVERYTEKITPDLVKVRPSKKQNYVAVTVAITATGEDQLRKIFLDLKTIAAVKMVL